MKNIIILIGFVALFSFSSCTSEESAGVSSVTAYAEMTLNGDEELNWEYGTPFVDPGCVALEGTTDISSKITVVSDVNANKVGRYHMTYNVLNGDGFAASISRVVYVFKASDPRNGYYDCKVERSYKGAAYVARGPFAESILVLGNGTDELWIEDLIGGWYYIGSSYGIDYATAGVLKFDTSVNPNTVTSLSGVEALPWGYITTLTGGEPSSYDTTTKTLLLNNVISSVPMSFRVKLDNPTPLN